MKRVEQQEIKHEEIASLKNEISRLNEKIDELEKDQFLFNVLLNNIPDTIYFKDHQSQFIRTSKSMISNLNQSCEEDLLGKTDFDIHDFKHARRAFEDEKKIMATGIPIINHEQRQINGDKEVWKSTTKMPLKNTDGKVIGTFGISRDITKRKEAEIESTAKERFLANMSHEIRTPMNAVIGLTKTLLNTDLSEEQRRQLEIIHTSGQNLLVVINDILDLSKLHAKKLVLENTHFRLSYILPSITAMFQDKVAQQGVELTYSVDDAIPEVLIGDASRLNQIMLNLIGNAVKFTRSGRIDVSCSLKKQTKKWNHIEFKISDTGVGMEDTSRIFEIYEQEMDSTSRNFGGTGLGLAICKEIVELFKGSITVTSKPGKGSVFNVVLPFKTGNKEQFEEMKLDYDTNFQRLKGKKILLVEDHEINQMVATTVLKQLKMEIDIAENGKESLKKLRKKEYDLVLMDLYMPIMNGYQAASHIRNTLKSKIPIITMTANALHGEKEKCLAVGMNDYISKPFDPDELALKMMELLPKKDVDNTSSNIKKSKIEPRKLYDLEGLPEVMRSNKEFRKEVMQMFIANTPELEQELRDHFDRNEINDVREVAHKLKSSFDLFNIKKLQRLIRRIENIPEDHKRSRLKRKITLLQDITELVIQQMKSDLAA